MNVLLTKLKEVLSSVAPIVILVVILHFTLAPVSGVQLFQFFAGALAIILGLAILLFGGILAIGKPADIFTLRDVKGGRAS